MSGPLNDAKTTVFTGLLLTFVLFTICVLASTFLPGLAGKSIPSSALFFISRLLFWISLALVYLYCIKRENQPLLLWAEKKHSAGFYLVSVIVILVVIIAGSGIIRMVAHFFKWSNDSNAIQAIFNYGVPLRLFIVITAAYVEEMIFRGYLMPRLQLFFKSSWWPVIISALVFGLGHIHYATFVNVAEPIFIGFVFAWHYQKYRNIKVVIICHFLIDFIVLMFLH